MSDKPVIICLTPVRNEAWILDTFLKCASLWADHIIIADQLSTDGSRDIALRYHKVILIDNDSPAYDELARQRLLLSEARKIPGKRLLIALDADEFLTADYSRTEDWSLLMKAEPGDSFHFRWINVDATFKKGWSSEFFPFAFLDNGADHTGRVIHSERLPAPEDGRVTRLEQIRILHFQFTSWRRMESKHRYYQCLERINYPGKDPIGIYRMYHHMYSLDKKGIFDLKDSWFGFYEDMGIPIRQMNTDDKHWFDVEILKMFETCGVVRFRKEAIWEVDWNEIARKWGVSPSKPISDPRNGLEKAVQSWMKKTQPFYKSQRIKKWDSLIGYFYFNRYYNRAKSYYRTVRRYGRCSEEGFLFFFIRCIGYRLRQKQVYAYKNTIIKGLDKLETKGALQIGLQDVGFMYKHDITFLNIRGRLVFEGEFSIGKGCRFDIGPEASVSVGKGGYVTAATTFIIMHRLVIGDNCAISWNCQFLDDDFHQLTYPDRKSSEDNSIVIGNGVWIGSNTCVYKGTRIADGCVVASNSVLKGVFSEKNVLIAGNPARIVKRDVKWS
jgi:acetyltransferase-like isoleucine patch superfamily enzyme